MKHLVSGDMLEFLEDRIYLMTLDEKPSGEILSQFHFFTIDDSLIYNPFHHDFGPLNIAHLYRFALTMHEMLSNPVIREKPFILYSKNDNRNRTRAACLIACYMVLVQNWPPHLALAPLIQADPPYKPFRDAGYAPADYGISIQDCVYGLWKAKEVGILNIKNLDLEEYETYERVEHGDFNWITPHFIAFASPVQPGYVVNGKQKNVITPTFMSVLKYFSSHRVGLVIRLNKPLYDKQQFERLGVEHVDMFFEDGTCPDLEVVRKFCGLVEEIFEKDLVVAVHCKAGLGRTGCLIGAYLIYKYSFTANEVIAYMRIMRPGMVVGPQQHWLHINQHHFKTWTLRSLPRWTKATKFSTPPRSPLGNIDKNNSIENTPLPVPTTGQPRKNVSSPRRSCMISLEDSLHEALTDDAEEDSIITTESPSNKHSESCLIDSTNILEHIHKEILRRSNPFITTPKKTANTGEKKPSASTNSNPAPNTVGVNTGRIAKTRSSKGRV
ncbi:hypothetical protein T552_02237 [Pneumocystis carinii B80]|uniref:protein-tyrosine-phosphatase n=1 Tax=Pneumocystis carinii (strain B80) TaxID=1408658 RepID=A0A0W4ZHE6_PNEC8|nr:hypothetical protein T552_02237 [Pneumocystis carinii B80]KTW27798.1 hypothetical protein T552_02237 [Pneumocystis carinii B80]